jgi:hypothetical protein
MILQIELSVVECQVQPPHTVNSKQGKRIIPSKPIIHYLALVNKGPMISINISMIMDLWLSG